MEPIAVVMKKEPIAASQLKEAEVVIQTEVICLDNDDDMSERCMKLDVRVKDRVPYHVWRTFAEYITYDSEDENYGKHGYIKIKLNFVDNH